MFETNRTVLTQIDKKIFAFTKDNNFHFVLCYELFIYEHMKSVLPTLMQSRSSEKHDEETVENKQEMQIIKLI